MKKIVVDEDTCLGCGFCFSSSDKFKMNDEGRAEANINLDELNENEKEEVLNIKEGCPVGAIKEIDE